MENTNLPKTTRIIDLLEELSEKEAQRAVLLTGPYTPDYVAKVAQDLLFEIAEIGAEIVQTIKDLEEALAAAQKRCSELSWAASPHATGQPYY